MPMTMSNAKWNPICLSVLNNNIIIHIVFRWWHLALHWYTTKSLFYELTIQLVQNHQTRLHICRTTKNWLLRPLHSPTLAQIRCAPIRHQTYLSQWWRALVPYVLLALDDLTPCRLVTSCGVIDWTITGACNGLLPDSTKPLSEPTLSCYQWDPLAFS